MVDGEAADADSDLLSISGITIPRREILLYLIAAAQGLEIMNLSIVNIALPSISEALGLTGTGLQWVISAYALMFGGFLLLGGRASDLFGRRRTLVSGLGLFGLASLLSAVATSPLVLLAGRAFQGLGAAITIPAALAMITTTFPEGAARDRALAIFGLAGTFGFAVGLLAGGVLTSTAGWRSVFLVNVPLAVGIAFGVQRLAAPGRIEDGPASLDLPGAATGTSGIILLVYALTQAETVGWASALTFGTFAVAAVLLTAFLWIESRADEPLMPLRLFRARSFTVANLVGIFLYIAFVGGVYFATLFVQDVLGYSSLMAGLAFLPMAIASIVVTFVAPRMLGDPRLGARWTMVAGMGLTALGLLWFSRLGPESAYVTFVLPIFVVIGVGLPLGYTAALSAGVAEIAERDHGAASGTLNAFFQIGAGLGPAILVTVAEFRESAVGGEGIASTLAGFEMALLVGGVLTALGALLALAVPKAQGEGESEAATPAD